MQQVVLSLILLPLGVMAAVNLVRDVVDPGAKFMPRFVWSALAIVVALVLVAVLDYDDLDLVPTALGVAGAATVWHQVVRLIAARRRMAGGR